MSFSPVDSCFSEWAAAGEEQDKHPGFRNVVLKPIDLGR